MKIKIEIDADAQEMRDFFGLPDVRPLQQQMLQQLQDNVTQMGSQMGGFDAMNLMKPLFPAQMASLDGLQKAFWESMQQAASSEANGGADGDTDSGGRKTTAKSKKRA